MALKNIGATLGAFGAGIFVGSRMQRGFTPLSTKRARNASGAQDEARQVRNNSRNTDTAELATPAGAVLDEAMSGRNFRGGGRAVEVTPEDTVVSEGNASASTGLHSEKPKSKSKKKTARKGGAKQVTK